MHTTLISLFLLFFFDCFGKQCAYDSYFYAKYPRQLSIAAIFQDEARFMKEWLDFHLSVGVEHFYLYNNNSTDDYMHVLKPYIKSGLVELIQWPGTKNRGRWTHFTYHVQVNAYEDAIERCENVTKWLALIDLDEFIVPVCGLSIPEILEEHFSHDSGICVNWQCYGTSNIFKIEPEEKSIKNLLYKMRKNHPKNHYCKSIVNPRRVKKVVDPHYVEYKAFYYHVDTNKNRYHHPGSRVLIDKLRINHYWTRDEYYLYQVKIPRWQNLGIDLNEMLKNASEMNEVFDDCILKFIR